ncbi:lipid-transfer protein [Striga asiatica]|uniref:Lipid-transfer protein n=1 Tax=Striga asiatica TaxID=4170 RepID=A0A5A7Q891_STRAF|nr:lipid-transfer protein [Striga asiatica]
MMRSLLILGALVLFGVARCDIEKDKERCANQLVGAATCLPYVSGEANAPPMDCCTGFNGIVRDSPECICLLVKDKDDPSLGLKINVTRALGLPVRCHAPTNLTVGDCPALLHLPPNSPDAKVFQDIANATNSTAAAAPARAGNNFHKMDGSITVASWEDGNSPKVTDND